MKRLVLLAGLLALSLLALPAGALARTADRDHDGMADRWEKRFRLSTHRDDARRDVDRDGLSNLGEFRAGTSPRDADSDDDGRRDRLEDPDRDRLTNAAEQLTGNHPRDPDSDDDGIKDGREQAGVIVSFDGAALTIDLANGGTVTGAVTDESDVSCELEDELDDLAEDGDDGDDESLLAGAAHDDGDESGEGEGGDDDGDHDGDGHELPGGGGDGNDLDEWDEGDGENDVCTAALKPGVAIHEAELAIGPEGTVFESIELVD